MDENNENNENIPQRAMETIQKRAVSTSKLIRQTNFLNEYPSNNYNISKTCQSIGIDRTTFSKWNKNDQAFRQAVSELKEMRKDYLEESLYSQAIKKEHIAAQIFLAKSVLGLSEDGPRPDPDETVLTTQQIDAIVEAGRKSFMSMAQLRHEQQEQAERKQLRQKQEELDLENKRLKRHLEEYKYQFGDLNEED